MDINGLFIRLRCDSCRRVTGLPPPGTLVVQVIPGQRSTLFLAKVTQITPTHTINKALSLSLLMLLALKLFVT